MDVILIFIVMIPQLALLYILYKLYTMGKKIYKELKPRGDGSSMGFLHGITSEDVRDMMQLVKKFI